MAHGGHGGAEGGGIESLTPRTGLFTALITLVVTGLAVGIIVRHPRVAAKAVLAGVILAALCNTNAANPTAHPLIGLLAIMIGMSLAPASRK